MILGLRGQQRGLAPIKGGPQFLASHKTPDRSSALTRQPQDQQDAVVEHGDDTGHARGPLWGLWPMASKLLARPTAIGCGQHGHSWLAS